MVLYILGNGFDLAHNLRTRYSNFKEWLENGDAAANQFLEELELMFEFGDGWKNFEEKLAFPNQNIEKKYNQQNCAKLFAEELKDYFSKWAYSIKQTEQFKEMEKIYNFEENAYFISFNYTHTLESSIYSIDIKRVLHIHGFDADHYLFKNTKMEVGHGDKKVLEGNSKIAIELFKDTSRIYKENRSFFNNLNSIDKIVIIGFSYSLIDRLYFDEILKRFPNAKWKLGIFSKDKDAKNNCKSFAEAIEINNYELFNYDIQDLRCI